MPNSPSKVKLEYYPYSGAEAITRKSLIKYAQSKITFYTKLLNKSKRIETGDDLIISREIYCPLIGEFSKLLNELKNGER